MVLCALPDCLEDVCFGEEELDVVVRPSVCGETLEEDDHFLEETRGGDDGIELTRHMSGRSA